MLPPVEFSFFFVKSLLQQSLWTWSDDIKSRRVCWRVQWPLFPAALKGLKATFFGCGHLCASYKYVSTRTETLSRYSPDRVILKPLKEKVTCVRIPWLWLIFHLFLSLIKNHLCTQLSFKNLIKSDLQHRCSCIYSQLNGLMLAVGCKRP